MFLWTMLKSRCRSGGQTFPRERTAPDASLADFCARRAQMEVGPSMCGRFGLVKVFIPCLRVTSAFTLAQPGRVKHLPGNATLQSSSGHGPQPYLT